MPVLPRDGTRTANQDSAARSHKRVTVRRHSEDVVIILMIAAGAAAALTVIAAILALGGGVAFKIFKEVSG